MQKTAKKQKRTSRPIYFRVERLVRVSTGEEVGALVPRYKCDFQAMRDRKYCVGTELRADLKKPRNALFHRLVHAVGQLLVEQVNGFELLDAHEAFKNLQIETGVSCDVLETDVLGLGVLQIKQPRSIAFDQMEEGEFSELFTAIVRLISQKYLVGMSEESIVQFCEMTAGTE